MWGDKPWALSKEDEEGLPSYKKQLKELQRCDQEVFYTPNEQPFTAEHLCVDGIRESEEYGSFMERFQVLHRATIELGANSGGRHVFKGERLYSLSKRSVRLPRSLDNYQLV